MHLYKIKRLSKNSFFQSCLKIKTKKHYNFFYDSTLKEYNSKIGYARSRSKQVTDP